MSKNLRLRIVSPDSVVFDGEVRSVQFMGIDGSYGILANHAPSSRRRCPVHSATRTRRASGARWS